MRRVAAAAVAAVLGVAVAPCAAADIKPPAGSEPIVAMTYDKATDALWLAGAQADSGVLVNANDGSTMTFAGKPESVQALASYDGGMLVGDIGDKELSRETITVFKLSSVKNGKATYRKYRFSYPDGPHDAKAMLISGRGRIYVVTSGNNPGIYRAELELSETQVNKLTRATDAPAGVTDGVFLADGSTMALRTAKGVEYIDAWTWKTTVTETIVGATVEESIAANPQDTIFLSGQGTIRTTKKPAADTVVDLAAQPGSLASASPSPSASASETVTEDPAAAADTSSKPNQNGTLAALALAAVAAVGAGAVTYLRKD